MKKKPSKDMADFLLGFIINLSGMFLCLGSVRILDNSTSNTPVATTVGAIVIMLASLPIMYLGIIKMESKVIQSDNWKTRIIKLMYGQRKQQ